VGFVDVEIVERHPFQLDDASRYPLFTPELIDMMRRLLPRQRQAEVATAITVQAFRRE
jgi:arsenite methyltransferase